MLCTSLIYYCGVLLPAIVASVYFPVLLPLAVAAVAAPAGMATIAAVQAQIPEDKQRLWSRPLIALMFLTQPVVRGWNRMRFRLLTATSTQKLPYYPVPAKDDVTCAFWTQGGMDRCTFLSTLVDRLQKNSQVRVDHGWGEHDVEVFATGWNRVRLVTVTEDLAQQRRMYRCRLEGSWTARTKLVFVLTAGVVAVAIDLLTDFNPWWWMLLLLLPFFYWFAEDDKLQLEQHTMTTIEEVAGESKWVPVTEPSPDKNAASPPASH
jgi:hypothetical protein